MVLTVLTANFDSFTEGYSPASLTDGGITFSLLDRLMPPNSADNPVFTVETIGTVADSASLGTFATGNFLTFGGYAPGDGYAFSRFGSMDISAGGLGSSVSIDIISDAISSSNNTLKLEALLNGVVVAVDSALISDFTPIVSGGFASHRTFGFSNITFDSLRLVSSGPDNNGATFIGIDNVSITADLSAPPPPSPNTLIATFDDGWVEGDVAPTIVSGGITFSNIDPYLPPDNGGNSTVGAIDALGTLDSFTSLGSFASANILTFGGYVPGDSYAFGRFGSMDISAGGQANSATLEIFSLPFGSPENTLTLQAFLNGVVVATDASLISDFTAAAAGSGTLHRTFSIANTPFDSLKLVASGPIDSGAVFIGIDNVAIALDGSTPPPPLDLNLTGTAGNDNLNGGAGNDTLFGDAGSDVLDGGAGNDFLDGGTGEDRLIGGTGEDTYLVNTEGDLVLETSTDPAEIDTVQSSANFILGDNLENLTLVGQNDIDGTGNALDNLIFGNSGNNRLQGIAGNDTLRGGDGQDSLLGGDGNDRLVGEKGADTLTGGTGADRFAFNATGEGIDKITDFSSVQGDKIEIFAAGFGGGLTAGVLSIDRFVLGSKALDSSDRLIYNVSKGALFFDIDGNGSKAAVQIATLTTRPSLSSADILVI
ncbi:calcium-binding protein [Pannus brasiliensis CCIBt3594]|uniref:Calcium-binding protein n=1 Tax=Pannus brasiliensis CCIBt3594 TaxID=1427578 RepID=A0AAW9QLS8_9CHRO